MPSQEHRFPRTPARRGQATCPRGEPVDSRCAVRDLPTAPRLGAFGLTRLRLPTAVEIEITVNSRTHKHQPNGVRGLAVLAVGACSQESIEFLAGRIKGTLFLLREAAMDQWPLITSDGVQEQLFDRPLSEFGCVVEVADDLATEQPQVVAMQVAGLA